MPLIDGLQVTNIIHLQTQLNVNMSDVHMCNHQSEDWLVEIFSN